MHRRNAVIAATVIAGLLGGPSVLGRAPPMWTAVPWSGLALIFIGCAVGLPLILGYLATSGKYAAMVRLWSFFGLLAVLSVAMGLSAAVQSAAGLAAEPNAVAAVVVGAGLFAGLGVVKRAIRRGRAKPGASMQA